MKIRTIVFLIVVAARVVAQAAEPTPMPTTPNSFPEAIERAMMQDAYRVPQAYPVPVTTPGTILQPNNTDPARPFNLESLLIRPQRKPVKDHAGWPFQAKGEIFSLPCFDHDCLYFGASDGAFYCVDKKSGVVRWMKEGLERVDSSPVLNDGTVYFASMHDKLHALYAESGKVRWEATYPGIGFRSPKMLNNSLYIAGTRQLLKLDPNTGKLIHRIQLDKDVADFSWNSKAILVTTNDFHGVSNEIGKGTVVCFSQGDFGKPQWTKTLVGACSNLACDENNCYLGSGDGVFYAIRIGDGKIAWQIDCRGFPAEGQTEVWAGVPMIDLGSQVVFGVGHQLINGPAALVLADKRTGKVIWTVRHPAQIEGQIFGVNGIIAAMTENRKMLLVNIADGKSATISPLPEILGEGLFGGQPCGQFAGITFDQGQLFIAGGDAHVWRLPWESVKGTLDWPIAQPAYKARP